MKIDIGKLISIIGVGMSAVERIKGAKGPDKERAVIDTVQEAVPQIESLAGIDFVNDPELARLLSAYVAARVALANAIAAAKGLKP